jgi:type II secretory pathway component PulM
MRTRNVYREHGVVTRRPRTIDWFWGLVVVLALLMTYASIEHADQRRDKAEAALRAQRQQPAQTAADAEMVARMRAAYEQGQADALEAARDSAGGLQIAATCLAWSSANKQALRSRVCGGGQ